MKLRQPGTSLIFAVTTTVFAVFFLWPLVESLRGAFVDRHGNFTLAYVTAVFENPVYVLGFRNSLLVALGSTLLSALIGVPLALIFTRYEFWGRRWLAMLIPLPLFVPPFVGAIGIQKLLGPRGALNAALEALHLTDPSAPIDWLQQGRFWAVVSLTALHLFPVLYFNLSAALSNQNPELEHAAETLGAHGLRKLWRVTLPLTAPSLFASLTIIFIWALTELGVPLLCDYGRVTSVQIFTGLKDIGQNPFVYGLVTVALVATLTLYGLSRLLLRRLDVTAGVKGSARLERQPAPGLRGVVFTGFAVLVLGSAALPNLSVILLASSHDWYATVLPSSFTLEHYRSALGNGMVVPSIAQSLRYVALSTAFDLVLGFAIAWVVVRSNAPGRKLLDALAMLPLAVPGLVLAFGYLAISREGRPLHIFDPARDPTVLLVVAYAMRRLPFVLRSAEAGLLQMSRSVEDAAQSLGAPPPRILMRVTLPLVLPHLLAGGLFAFALSMLEVSDSLVLAQQQAHYPVTKAIWELSQLVGEGRLLAAALGVWAMLLLATAVWVARRLVSDKSAGLSEV
ncbi:MAG TPA: iron ABC transporter permease [Polyangiaceae bacterium]|nr:iron ABC transporter permease [Polyangiaceae bacterium]